MSEPDRTSTVLADFDGVTYKIATEAKTVLTLSMAWRCFKELQQYGAEQVLAREYGGYLQSTPEIGYDVTLSIDLQQLPADTGRCFLM
jgi:actin related protein 2/3 complex subunit 2